MLAAFIFIIIGVIGCNKILDDVKNAKVDFVSHWGLKIADVSLMINDSLHIPIDSIDGMGKTSMVLFPGEEGIIEMHFEQEFKPVTLDTIVKYYQESTFKDTIEFRSLSNFFIEGNTRMGFQLGTFSNNNDFKNARIDSLKLDKGILRLDFDTYQHFNSKFSFTFPGISNENNEILKLDEFIPDVTNHSVKMDLSNHKVQVLRENNKEYFIIDFQYFLESRNDEIEVEPRIYLTFEDLDIDYAYGNFTNVTIQDLGEDTISLFQQQLIVGEDIKIDFKKPEIELHTFNSFGLPFIYKVRKLTMYFPDGDSSNITGVPEQIYIEAPTNPDLHHNLPSVIKIDPSTNIDLLLGRSPTRMAVNGNLTLNPVNPRTRNYLRDEDTLSVVLDIDLPFQLSVSKLTFKETFQDTKSFFNLKSSSMQAQEIEIKTDVSNSFPFELDLQVYFADKDTLVIDSLFQEPVKISGSGIENSAPVKATYYSDKNRNEIERLYKTQNIILEAGFETANAEEEMIVSFTDNHSLDIELTVFTKLNVQSGNE